MSLKINYDTAMRLIAKYEKKLKKINELSYTSKEWDNSDQIGDYIERIEKIKELSEL